MGVWEIPGRNRLAGPSGAVLPCGGPRRRDAGGQTSGDAGDGRERHPAGRAPSIIALPRRASSASPRISRRPSRPSTSSAGAPPAGSNRVLMDAKHIWRAALGELQVALSPANFETWLRHTSLVDVDDNRFRIAVPNGFAKDWLETRYRPLISQTLARIVGYSVRSSSSSSRGRRRQPGTAGSRRPTPAGPGRADAGRRRGGGSTNLNPRYTFANFIVGSANRLAHAAAPLGRRAPGPRLQPALPLRRRGPRQDPPDARDRERGHRPLPAQEGRLRDEREVHERVHHEHPAGPDRRLPGPLPADRPPPRSTTSSSSPTRSGPRRSSSTRSTPSTRTASRSSSRRTARRSRS